MQSLEYWPIEKFINYEKKPRKDAVLESTGESYNSMGVENA
jgi:hypothetical protein